MCRTAFDQLPLLPNFSLSALLLALATSSNTSPSCEPAKFQFQFSQPALSSEIMYEQPKV